MTLKDKIQGIRDLISYRRAGTVLDAHFEAVVRALNKAIEQRDRFMLQHHTHLGIDGKRDAYLREDVITRANRELIDAFDGKPEDAT